MYICLAADRAKSEGNVPSLRTCNMDDMDLARSLYEGGYPVQTPYYSVNFLPECEYGKLSRGLLLWPVMSSFPAFRVRNHLQRCYPYNEFQTVEVTSSSTDAVCGYTTTTKTTTTTTTTTTTIFICTLSCLYDLKARPKARNISTQHLATLCYTRLATLWQHVARYWMVLDQV